MDNYRFTLGIEPADKYEKAKQDLLQALKSVGELSPSQQRMLVEELFGAAQVAMVFNAFRQYFG